jgi:hypothetical protein
MCNATCRATKREAGRRGGQATVAKLGPEHMSKIGKAGFHMLAMRLGDGHCNRQAALYVLAGKGKLTPYTATPTRPWRGAQP